MDKQNTDYQNPRYELFILAISIISLGNILLFIIPMTEEMDQVVLFYDSFLSLVLLGDFFYRLFTAPDKRAYFFSGFGWLDFVGSLPLPFLRLARLHHVVRTIRAMRREGRQKILNNFRRRGSSTALFMVLFLILLSMEWASLMILNVETDAATGKIHTASDALWWAYVSITTVGYGDLYPVTDEGRAIGVVLLAIGVGLFSVLTGFLAEIFTKPRRRRKSPRPGAPENELHAQLEVIKGLLAEQEQANVELRHKIDELERVL